MITTILFLYNMPLNVVLKMLLRNMTDLAPTFVCEKCMATV